MPVVKVAQSDLLRLRMPVPEEDVPFIKVGGDVSIKLQATGKTFNGKIIRFTRELTTSTRTMLAEVDVPNPDLALSTGMTAETAIILQAQKSVLTVPAGAVLKGDGQASVLVVDSDNKVQKVPVTLGIQNPDRIEITQGLSEHQSVIISGQTNYQPGQVVRPQAQYADLDAEAGGRPVMSSFAIKYPFFVLMMCLFVIVIGVTAVTSMPVDLFPEVNIPVVVVATFMQACHRSRLNRTSRTVMSDSSHWVAGIDHIESRSLPGVSLIKIYFQPRHRCKCGRQ